MKKLTVAALVFFLLAAAHAQEGFPVADVSAGYSYLFVAKGFTLSMNGGSSAVAFNINHVIGIVGDVGVYDGSLGIPGLIGETYMVGPRFSLRRWSRLIPFAQGLIGGGHSNTVNGGFLGAHNAFAFGAGAGGDLGLDRSGRFALRGQMEFINFRASGNNTGTVRLSTGVVFRFGRREYSR